MARPKGRIIGHAVNSRCRDREATASRVFPVVPARYQAVSGVMITGTPDGTVTYDVRCPP